MKRTQYYIIFGGVLLLVCIAALLWVLFSQNETDVSVIQPRDASVPTVPVPRNPDEPPVVPSSPSTPGPTQETEAPNTITGWLDQFIPHPTVSPAPLFSSAPNTSERDVERVLSAELKTFSDSIVPAGRVVIVSTYALQRWGDENSAGVALLKYVNGAWEVVDVGGGAPSGEWLLSLGVPRLVAAELLVQGGF